MTDASLFTRLRQRISAGFSRPQVLWLQEDGRVRELDEASALPWVDWLGAHPGTAVELIVPAALQHQLVCEPGLPLEDDEALVAYASQQFSHYFGTAAQRWAMAPWRSGTRNGAVALHGVDLVAMQQAATTARVDLRAVRPAWSFALAWNLAEQRAWFQLERASMAWVEGPLLTWIRFEQGECVELRHQRLQDASVRSLKQVMTGLSASQLNTLVLGFGLRGDTKELEELCWLVRLAETSPDPSWFVPTSARQEKSLPAPDFVGRGRTYGTVAWALALTGLVSLGLASWEAKLAFEARQEAQVLEMRLSGKTIRSDRHPNAKAVVQDAGRWSTALNAKLLQDYGWEATLADVERVAESGEVSWLALDVQPARSELVLEGIAKDKGAAIRSAQSLESLAGWTSVLIRQVQVSEGGQQRFELGAKLTPAALRPPAVLGAPR